MCCQLREVTSLGPEWSYWDLCWNGCLSPSLTCLLPGAQALQPPSPLVSGWILRPFGLENQRPTLKGSPFGMRAHKGDEELFAVASSEISVPFSGSSWSP